MQKLGITGYGCDDSANAEKFVLSLVLCNGLLQSLNQNKGVSQNERNGHNKHARKLL